ncbi:hypothetical protein BZA77DRAFT_344939 [Pyronema omphalodes]|nr:hypothetical protein BZA77DRAFT_344939 [Pyronema omphalodes]
MYVCSRVYTPYHHHTNDIWYLLLVARKPYYHYHYHYHYNYYNYYCYVTQIILDFKCRFPASAFLPVWNDKEILKRLGVRGGIGFFGWRTGMGLLGWGYWDCGLGWGYDYDYDYE